MKNSHPILLTVICLIAVIAGIYIFRPHELFFLADDFIHIPESAHNILEQRNSLRPAGNFSLHLNYLWSDVSPYGYHLTNLLLHIINSFLVLILCKNLLAKYALQTNQVIFSIVVSVVFFIYPFHSESVFWIIGRSGMLGALFTVPAIIFYLKRNASYFYFLSSLACFQLALFSYESSWIFPLLAMIFSFADIRLKQSKAKIEFIKNILVWIVFIVNLFIRMQVTGELLNAYDTGAILSFDLKILGLNFFRLFFRTMLPPFVYTNHFVLATLIAFTVIILFIVALKKLKKIQPLFFLLTFCWIISYLPYLALGIDTHGVEGGRYLYLPAIFFCIWILYILFNLLEGKWFLLVISILIIGNIYYLLQARSYFVKAGVIVKTTYEQINSWQQKHVIFLENLPQYNRGAVVFRLGFEEGLQWLYPGIKTKIIITSIDDSDLRIREKFHPDFTVKYNNAIQLKPVISYLQKDTTFTKTYRKEFAENLFFVPGEDVWFSFSDSTLLISK